MYAVLLTQYVFVPQCYGLNFLDMQFKPQKVTQGHRYGVFKKKKSVSLMWQITQPLGVEHVLDLMPQRNQVLLSQVWGYIWHMK